MQNLHNPKSLIQISAKIKQGMDDEKAKLK
jgi:hypothetical protein